MTRDIGYSRSRNKKERSAILISIISMKDTVLNTC